MVVVVANSRNGAIIAVALNCGMGSRALKALVNVLDKLHIVRGANTLTESAARRSCPYQKVRSH